MDTVIFGLSKTGTSALFYKLRTSLPPTTICLFEPVSRGLLKRARVRFVSALTRTGRRSVLAKVLPFRSSRPVNLTDFAHFDKQVLTVRDPRDRMVSALLYRAYNSELFRSQDCVATLVRLLRRKEEEPRAVSLSTILQCIASAGGERFDVREWLRTYDRLAIREPLVFHRERPHLFVFHYEDLVERRYEELERYLGYPATGSDSVPREVLRVERTRRSGGWRDWFTNEDVERFGPVLQPYLDRYYPDAVWELREVPRIDPEHGSRYVAMLVAEKRRQAGLAPIHIS